MYAQIDRYIGRYTCIDIDTDIQIYKYIYIIDRQIDRQIDRYIYDIPSSFYTYKMQKAGVCP